MFAVGLWVITPLIGAPLLQETWLFIAVLSMFFVQVLSRWVVKVFEGLGETRRSGMVQTAFGWTSPAGQVGCALLGLGISGIVYAQIAGNGLILILLFFVLLTNFAGLGVKTTPVPTKKIVRYSIPLMLLNGTAFVYSAGGTLIAKTFGSINDVSYYGLATQIVVVLQIPAFAFASSTAPIVASQRDASIAKEASQNAIRFIIIAYAPMAFYIAIAAPGVVRLLFTEAYAPAAILLVILQPYLMASALSGFLSLLLDYSGKAQQRIYIIGTASVVFLISAFVAAERYGTAGVAWAAVGTYLPVVIFYAYLVSREFGIPLCFYSTLFLRTIISLLPGAMLISLATSTHSSIILSITIFLSLSVYIAISFYMRSICVNDIKAVVSVLRK
jgi:O-antigen/teichoic acid export membrane protein